ncbi:MAG: GNAT family N-acetyltransferase [Thermoanaerobaculia bacterium]
MIQGKLVRLRTMEVADLADVKAVNDDPQVRANVVGWGWPTSKAEMERWHEKSQGGATHRWAVIDENERVIGVTGLWDVDFQSRHAMTALKLGGVNEVRGRGLGTDAIKAVMAFAFYDVGLHRLYTSIIAGNVPSVRAYVEKCGWRREGVSREHVWRHGRFVDLQQVGILKAEFDELPDARDYVRLITGKTG